MLNFSRKIQTFTRKTFFFVLILSAIAIVMLAAYRIPDRILDTILVSFAVNVVVACIFYFMLVYLPKQDRLDAVKVSFRAELEHRKENILRLLLQLIDRSEDQRIVQDLMDPAIFRDYFRAPFIPGQHRWHGVMNALEKNEGMYNAIVFQLVMLREECMFLLGGVRIGDPTVLRFFKIISERIFEIQHDEHFGDEVRTLTGFLWELFANWSSMGYRDDDIFEDILGKLDEVSS